MLDFAICLFATLIIAISNLDAVRLKDVSSLQGSFTSSHKDTIASITIIMA